MSKFVNSIVLALNERKVIVMVRSIEIRQI